VNVLRAGLTGGLARSCTYVLPCSPFMVTSMRSSMRICSAARSCCFDSAIMSAVCCLSFVAFTNAAIPGELYLAMNFTMRRAHLDAP